MSRVDLVRFLPTTESEVIAKRANYQFEQRLRTQLRGIEKQEKTSRIIIEKSNSVLKQHIMLRRQKSTPTSPGTYSSSVSSNSPYLQHQQQYFQGCLRMSENGGGESFCSLNRRALRDDSLYYKPISRSPTGYEKRQSSSTKKNYLHRSVSRASSVDSYNNSNPAVAQDYPTAIPKRISQSFEVAPPHDCPIPVRSASHLDLTSRYNKWCESVDKMNNNTTNNTSKRYVATRQHRSNTVSDLQDIRLEDVSLDLNEETSQQDQREDSFNNKQQQTLRKTSAPRKPDTEKPILRRQQRLCRVSSLPGSIAALSSSPPAATPPATAPSRKSGVETCSYLRADLTLDKKITSSFAGDFSTDLTMTETREKKGDVSVVEIIPSPTLDYRKKSAQRDSVDNLLPLMENNSLICDNNNTNRGININYSGSNPRRFSNENYQVTSTNKVPLKVSQSWDGKSCSYDNNNAIIRNGSSGCGGEHVLPKISKKKLRMTKSVQ